MKVTNYTKVAGLPEFRKDLQDSLDAINGGAEIYVTVENIHSIVQPVPAQAEN